MVPLEWGLGHATRCIPLIEELLAQNCEVLLGAEGAAKTLLEQEFPQLTILPLQGYQVKYSRKKNGLPLKLLLQTPGIIRSIYRENRWLKKTIRQYSINAVISDNRPGLYNVAVPCIYITHQLTIKTGTRFTEWIAQKIHYHYINKYNACWIPDAAGENNLAGELSHPAHLPKTIVQYLGPLSRFKKMAEEKKYDLAIIISGPEPQRTIFERVLLKDLEKYEGKCIVIRGLPNDLSQPSISNPSVEIHNHLSAAALNKAIQGSSLVISRSGYTTIMDLVKLQQKAVLIPTPGQTEQEYLGRYLAGKKYFYSITQNDFSLTDLLKITADISFARPVLNLDDYKVVIKNFICELKKD